MMSDHVIAEATALFGAPSPRRFKIIGPLPVRGQPDGLYVRIRSLTEREVSGYQSVLVAKKGDGLRTDRLKDANRRLIALCLVDGDGNPYVTLAMQSQMADWDAADTGFLYDECANHCGLNKSDIEDLVKNSEGITVADSPSN